MTPKSIEANDGKKLKRYTVLGVLFFIALTALTLGQPWVVVELRADAAVQTLVSQSGSSAASLVAYSLALAAAVGALLLTGPILRYVLAVIIVALGTASIATVIGIRSQPLDLIHAQISELTGLSGPGLEAQIRSLDLTWWSLLSLVLLILITLSALVILFTAHKWPKPTKKYSRDEEDETYSTTWGKFERDDEEDEHQHTKNS